jgi:SAM-dependent methyltransferase
VVAGPVSRRRAGGRSPGQLTPYAAPLYYHVAFELNRKAETEFLAACFRRYGRGRVRHVLDVACGTGHHSLRLARRGHRVTALDLSEPSIAFLRSEADRAGLPVTAMVGDMTDFRLPRPVDAAICMQDSQGHLLTTGELVAHLRAVRRNLRPGGVFVFDRLVPNGWSPGARWTWTRRRRGITVRTTFQTLLDYDVARQVCHEVMRFEITEDGRQRVVTQRHPTRIVFPQELRAVVELAGGFEFCAWFSNFSFRRPLERSAAALVMVIVLRAA